MPFNYNGNTVNGVTFNGNTVNKVNYNGVTVWEKATEWPGLCFTAEEAGSTVELYRSHGSVVQTANSAYSRDGVNWTSFTTADVWGTNAVTLENIGDKVYFRNDIISDASLGSSIRFRLTGKVAASGNVNSIYVHEGFEELEEITYKAALGGLFYNADSLTTPPKFPATTLSYGCYSSMFMGCDNLEAIPELPATVFKDESGTTEGLSGAYFQMFMQCPKIKMSLTQDSEYTNTYTFGATPTSTQTQTLSMFQDTGGSFTDTPTVQTLYTANEIVR